jgi:UDP-glucose 4-epimerase
VPVRLADRRPGDPAEAVASNAKARELLGWSPQKSLLDDIVSDAWSAHKSF